MNVKEKTFSVSFFIALLSSSFCHAAITRWSGPLKITSKGEKGKFCDGFIVTSFSKKEFGFGQVLSGYCWYKQSFRLERDGNILYYEGRPVGQITPNRVTVTNLICQHGDESCQLGGPYSVDIQFSGATATYADRLIYTTGLESRLNGVLKKVNQ